MKNLFKNIKYYFLSLKEKSLQDKLKNTTKRSYTNKTSKIIYGRGAEVNINSETQKLIASVKEGASAIVKKTNCEPEELLNYVNAAKTPVYKLKNADKFLNLIKEEEGLIYEKQGLEAVYLSIITGRGFSLKTPAMFVLRDGIIDKFYMLHHFYRWCSLKAGLSGFEYETQKYFKRFLYDDSDDLIKTLSMEKILSLKEAIARDQEASAFVLQYTKETDGSKNVIDKIQNEGGANI